MPYNYEKDLNTTPMGKLNLPDAAIREPSFYSPDRKHYYCKTIIDTIETDDPVAVRYALTSALDRYKNHTTDIDIDPLQHHLEKTIYGIDVMELSYMLRELAYDTPEDLGYRLLTGKLSEDDIPDI